MIRLLAFTLAMALPIAAPSAQQQREQEPSALFQSLPTEMSSELVFSQKHLHFSVLGSSKAHTLFAWGGIDRGDSERFRAALDEAKPVFELMLFSPGGDLDEGMEIGRIVRARHITTRVPRGAQCVSACNFMLMGGTVRFVEVGAVFKVHMFSSDISETLKDHLAEAPHDILTFNTLYPQAQLDPAGVQKYLDKYNRDHADHPLRLEAFLLDQAIDQDVKNIQQNSAQIAAMIAGFLTEMSISLRFLTEFADIPNDAPRALTRQEMRSLNVVNAD
ncbi:MAG: hypothetical protein ACLQJR_11570 [Stellaceae bacterium]